MRQVAIGVGLAAVLAAAVIGALQFLDPGQTGGAPADVAGDVAALRAELAAARAEIERFGERLGRLEAARPRRADPDSSGVASEGEALGAAGEVAEAGAAEAGRPGVAGARAKSPAIFRPYSDEMKRYVFDLIEEERRTKRADRDRRSEERRREIEEFKKGPYGDYNVKVHSLAKVLGLDRPQMDAYFELGRAFAEKTRDLFAGQDGSDPNAMQKAFQEHERLNGEFDAGVQNLLSAEQREIYRKIPGWARSLENRDYVGGPGEGEGNIAIRLFGGDPAAAGGIQLQGVLQVGGQAEEPAGEGE